MVPYSGKFLVFEGTEGSGKTTQAKLLHDCLVSQKRNVLLTKEPGGDDGVCRDIRKTLLNPEYKDKFSPCAEVLLFEADRAQHVEFVIKPALFYATIVISDRYEGSTFAYQCGGRQIFKATADFWMINHIATRGLRPDFTFWIDIEPEVGLERNRHVGKRDRLEMEDIEFHHRVRDGYNTYFNEVLSEEESQKDKWIKLDGAMSQEEIHEKVINTLNEKRLL